MSEKSRATAEMVLINMMARSHMDSLKNLSMQAIKQLAAEMEAYAEDACRRQREEGNS